MKRSMSQVVTGPAGSGKTAALNRIERKFLKKPLRQAFRIDMSYLTSVKSLDSMFNAIENASKVDGPESVLVILDDVTESDKDTYRWKLASDFLWRLSRQGINFAVAVETAEVA